MGLKLIVGLGNPGHRYQWTRHNAGFMVLDRLSHVAAISVTKKCFSGLCGEGTWQDIRLLLMKPQTFMNLSGRSVAEAVRFHKLSSSDVIVIHDDIDIPFGRVKLKNGGGHGGHNGLRSLLAELGNGDFTRIRVGIGRPGCGEVVDYVLSSFDRMEMDGLMTILDGAVDMLENLLAEGLNSAMNLHNNRVIFEVPKMGNAK
jgi:peptidyl-tRNA hydrolase, PTH1 family